MTPGPLAARSNRFPFPRLLLTRRHLLPVLALLAAAGACLFLSLGHLVMSLDPIQRSDAIYVLGGSRVNRVVEALRLYREGAAPRIVLSGGAREYGEAELAREGIHLPNDAEVSRDLLVTKLHVPAAAVIVLPDIVDNTAQEADAIKPVAEAEGWHQLIVITERTATRRAGFAFRRVLSPRVTVIVTSNRDDPYNPNRWWSARWSVRSTFYEAPKLLAYWLGLRG
jgi:uncharacterized SAM-binding protein YcdF (DUF218 family)